MAELEEIKTEAITEEKTDKISVKKSAKKADEGNKDLKYKKKKMPIKDIIKAWGFLMPSFLGVLAFFIAPFGIIIFYSVINNPIAQKFVGIENFKNVITNTAFRQAAHNTLIFSLIAVPLATILSLLMAMILEENIPFKSSFRTFFLSPLMVPVASIVLIWQVLFDYHGVLNDIIGVFGGNSIDWLKSEYGPLVVVILFLWKNLGYNMILYISALGGIPKDVLEVSTLDGAGYWRQFFYIKLRYLTPTIFFVGILSLINSFKVFREVYLLAGDYPFSSLYTLQHYMNNTFRSLDYQKLSSAALIMSVVMVLIIGVLFALEHVLDKDLEG